MTRARAATELAALFCALAFLPPAIHGQPAAPLRQIGTLPLPNVSGRIDHLAFDAARQHLVVAALGHDTVEILDTATGTHVRSLTGFHEPQGVAVVPDLTAVAVANGGTGTLQLFDAQTFATRWTVRIGGDADNVRYDAAARRLYVAAEGGLFAVDAASGKVTGRVSIDGHPESFQLESAGTRIDANLPGRVTSQVVVSDRARMAVAARWSAIGCGGNYPMALDDATSRVFVGCRRPARLAMLDGGSGALVASIEVAGDTDDLFYDAVRRRVYVVGGEGFVDVVRRQGDTLQRMTRLATRRGARTGLWVPPLSRLYVAVPARGGEPAEVRVFEAG